MYVYIYTCTFLYYQEILPLIIYLREISIHVSKEMITKVVSVVLFLLAIKLETT